MKKLFIRKRIALSSLFFFDAIIQIHTHTVVMPRTLQLPDILNPLGNLLHEKKHVARNMLAPNAVAFMQHIPYARVRIHSGAFFV